MKSLVVGLVMLASGVVREREPTLDLAARRPLGQGPGTSDGGAAAMAVAGTLQASLGVDQAFDGAAEQTLSVSGDDVAAPITADAPGDWEVACQRKSGNVLVFDRQSLRELGGALLVRWAAPNDEAEAPRTDEQIFTAVVSCHEKTIEASWPGKRSDTRAGTCGRRLVDAVCAAATPSGPRGAGRRAVLK